MNGKVGMKAERNQWSMNWQWKQSMGNNTTTTSIK